MESAGIGGSLAAEIAEEEARTARKPPGRRGVGKASVRKRQRPGRPTRSADARHSDHGS